MPINPEVEKYLENSRQLQIPLKTLVKLVITKPVTVLKLLKSRDSLEDLTGITPEVVRYYYESVSRPGPEVHSVEDKEIQEGIPIRIYRPKGILGSFACNRLFPWRRLGDRKLKHS